MSVETLVEAADAAQVAVAALVDAVGEDADPALVEAVGTAVEAVGAFMDEAYTLGEEAGILEPDDSGMEE